MFSSSSTGYNHQRNCWDKSENFYIAKFIAQFLSPYPSTKVEIEQKPRDIIWLDEFNNGCGVGRAFSLKLGLYLKIFEKFKLSQLFLLMINHQRNCWDKSENFYIAKFIAQRKQLLEIAGGQVNYRSATKIILFANFLSWGKPIPTGR